MLEKTTNIMKKFDFGKLYIYITLLVINLLPIIIIYFSINSISICMLVVVVEKKMKLRLPGT